MISSDITRIDDIVPANRSMMDMRFPHALVRETDSEKGFF